MTLKFLKINNLIPIHSNFHYTSLNTTGVLHHNNSVAFLITFEQILASDDIEIKFIIDIQIVCYWFSQSPAHSLPKQLKKISEDFCLIWT